ncbi:MAG TPA: HD domain-containing protein [Stellaceae bacterium]|nr:HD domain-containing protein [Stellaceae bacterium]
MAPPEAIGDLPDIIANEEGLYEGNLIPYLRAIFFKASNLGNPYHNFRHTMHVTWLSHKACRYYRNELSPRRMRHLLIATMFHDFNHPGHPHPGEEDPDRINIRVAVKGLRRHIVAEDRASLRDIETLIEATHFPYRQTDTNLDLAEQIIRDADLAQALSPVWIQQVVIGLALEGGIPPLDILKLQPRFLGGLHFNTDWAREMFPQELIDGKIAEARKLQQLLEDAPPAAG